MGARITAIDPATAQGKARELLDGVQRRLGLTPNMMRTMARSPAALEAYLAFGGALAGGALPAKFREQLALAVAEENGCDYCAAAHTALGRMVGLTDEQAAAARRGEGTDAKVGAAIRLARSLLERRGDVGDADLAPARAAGFGNGEIAEVVAHVALNVYTNYFNQLARTEIDFPKVELGAAPSG
jgi:uncharacterized peroxidase-related enzyme